MEDMIDLRKKIIMGKLTRINSKIKNMEIYTRRFKKKQKLFIVKKIRIYLIYLYKKK